MSRESGLIHGWLPAEDDLLLQYFHNSHPGGRFDGPQELARWPIISENMTRTAPALGLKGPYSSDHCAKRYARYILPQMTFAAAQHQAGRIEHLKRELNPINPYEGVLAWISDTQLAEGNGPQPVSVTMGDLMTWEYLVHWATRIQEYPSQIFIEPGKIPEFEINPDVKVAVNNKMGIRAQYELDYFNELLNWATIIVRQSVRESDWNVLGEHTNQH